MKTPLNSVVAAVALSTALLIPGALAQSADAPAAGRPIAVDFQVKIDQRLARQKEQLKITPNQEAAWQTYSDTMKQTMQRKGVKRGDTAKEQLSAPERMNRQIERMKQRLASMEVMATAMQNLYAQLSPEQRVIADQQAARFQRKHRR